MCELRVQRVVTMTYEEPWLDFATMESMLNGAV
jgi:hypothetical protein